MKKKISAIIGISVISLVGYIGVVVSAINTDLPDNNDTIAPVVSQKEEEAQPQELPTPVVESVPEKTVPNVEPPANEEEPVVKENPLYGAAGDGTYTVFDKTTVMIQAGIASEDHQYVMQLVKGWTYKNNMGTANLCGVFPASRMSSAGADYEDNPVTQLKWCTSYITSRYDSWMAAHQFYTERGFF